MKISRLKVETFRNLEGIEIIADSRTNIICGDNAQGKTNILETLWLFTGSRTFRPAKESDFIPKTGDIASISIDFYKDNRDQTALIRWHNGSRLVELNGVKKNSTGALSGIFLGVIFTPDDLSLIKAGPENRRNMIDISLTQTYPKYNKALLNYNKALKQRNTLLKDAYHNPSVLDILEVWDEHIINYGSYITLIRERYINKLSPYASEIYKGISDKKEQLVISYKANIEDYKAGFSLEEIKKLMKQSLASNRSEDIRTGNTSAGPHRDDLEIMIDNLNARNFGSQGQQRSSILSLKLAECKIIEEQTGEVPVVMLDDVMSELDNSRKSYLLNKLKDKQVFITGCDSEVFSKIESGKIFHIEAGKIKKEQEV